MNKYLKSPKLMTCILWLTAFILLPKASAMAETTPSEVWDATNSSIFGQHALRDGEANSQSNQLQYIIDEASRHGKAIYIPSGEYILAETVNLRNNTQITGDLNEPTILRATNATVQLDDSNYAHTSGIKIKNLFFDGVSIFTRRSHDIVIQNNVFYNPLTLYPVRLTASNGAELTNNIFMRDIAHATPDTENRAIYVRGFATSTVYEYMEDVLIENNLFGLKLNELDAIKSFSNPSIIQTIERLQRALEEEKIDVTDNEQNYLSTGVNSYNNLKNTLIKDNFFYQMYENEDRFGVVGDHAIYLRGSQNVQVIGNHVRGLHNGPYGGFKFKSGRDITIMNNYLRNTGIIMYETPEYGLGDSFEEGTVAELSGWLVANNIFDFKEWQDRYAIGIEYNRHTGIDNVFNGVFMDNHFVNYHNLWTGYRRELLIQNNNGEGFKGESTFVAGNTRDDTADRILNVEFWTEQDILMMPTDWTALVDSSDYELYKNSTIPVRNTLPIAQNRVITLGEEVSPYDLVDHTHDNDEAKPEATILNPEVLTTVGNQKVTVLLTYHDSTTVTINSIVTVQEAPDPGIVYAFQDGGNATVIDYTGSNTDLVIPSVVTHQGIDYTVTGISQHALQSKNLTSVKLPITVGHIPNYGFAASPLDHIELTNPNTTFGEDPFRYNRLHYITVPEESAEEIKYRLNAGADNNNVILREGTTPLYQWNAHTRDWKLIQ